MGIRLFFRLFFYMIRRILRRTHCSPVPPSSLFATWSRLHTSPSFFSHIVTLEKYEKGLLSCKWEENSRKNSRLSYVKKGKKISPGHLSRDQCRDGDTFIISLPHIFFSAKRKRGATKTPFPQKREKEIHLSRLRHPPLPLEENCFSCKLIPRPFVAGSQAQEHFWGALKKREDGPRRRRQLQLFFFLHRDPVGTAEASAKE